MPALFHCIDHLQAVTSPPILRAPEIPRLTYTDEASFTWDMCFRVPCGGLRPHCWCIPAYECLWGHNVTSIQVHIPGRKQGADVTLGGCWCLGRRCVPMDMNGTGCTDHLYTPHVGSMALTWHPDEYTSYDWPSAVTAPGGIRSLIQYIENESGPSWPNTYPSPELSLIIYRRHHSPSMGRTHHIHGLITDNIPPPITSYVRRTPLHNQPTVYNTTRHKARHP